MTKEEILKKHDEPDCNLIYDGDNAIIQYDGPIPQILRSMDEYVKQREEYWKLRCLAAEDYIAKSPCDPDITKEQIEAHEKWSQLFNNQFIEQQNK